MPRAAYEQNHAIAKEARASLARCCRSGATGALRRAFKRLFTMEWGCRAEATAVTLTVEESGDSAALELRLAFFVERADAFLAVFGSNEAIVGRDLELHGRSEVHAEPLANGAPRLANRERCVGRDSRGGLERRIEQPRWLAQPVDDAPGKRLLRRKGPRCEDQLLCTPLAHGARERLRAAAWHDAERHLGERESRRFRGIGEIAKQHELEAARVRGAVDRGDHRDRAVAHRAEHALENPVLRAPLLLAERVALLQVGAGAEGLVARAGEHDAAAPPLGLKAFEKLAEVERSPRVEGVGDLGPVEGRQKQVTGRFLHPRRVVFPLHAAL